MATKDIKTLIYSRPVDYLGRNGMGQMRGLNMCRNSDNSIFLQPINSKNKITDACMLDIPIEDLKHVIMGLIEMLPNNNVLIETMYKQLLKNKGYIK